jgi:hypothetical protein
MHWHARCFHSFFQEGRKVNKCGGKYDSPEFPVQLLAASFSICLDMQEILDDNEEKSTPNLVQSRGGHGAAAACYQTSSSFKAS